ncbi:uncharacterized protein LOC112568022 isoform X2 [Pomacea canaliculata]|uniref:uncharacterized protein LOC112568022 isoform X2 n=1 Tax=Pomacea canaliculata TaxID=400727 RepID=UPI000D738372|nr:uncharacterized protein LOC112568022 isoform X2 [Pomacea canaliculata]
MASEHQEKFKHAVHVLSCLNGECKPHIERLVQLLEERGVQCVYQARGDYGIGGLFATRFKDFFGICERTVIHICQESIETVKEFEEILLDGAEKTSFFRIPCSPLDSSKFIKQFNVWDLSEEPVLKRFIEEISKKRSDSLDLPKAFDEPSLPVSSDELHMVSPVVSPKTFKAVSFIHRGAVYPVLHVDESFLLPSSVEEHIRKSFQRNINPERSSKEDLFFILNEVLPDLYKQGDITRLSQLTRSHQPLLRDRALRYIELLLLLSEEPPPSVSDMKETETSLFSLFSDAEISQEDETLIRVIVTYIMTLVRFIMACHSEGNDGECDRHLNAITHRKLFKNPKLMKNDKKSAIKKTGALIKVVQNCVHCWHKNCKKLQNKIISTEDCSNNKAKQPPSKELQLFLLVSSLIQLNKDGNFAPYSHRFYQLNLKKSTGASLSKQFEIILVHINICGLRTFLEHRTMTEELGATFNFSEGCKETIKILSELLLILDENERPQLLKELTTLLFHHNKDIRKESSKLYNEDKIITMTYNLWENLFLTSKELVSPLTKNVSTEYSFPFHVDWGWTVVKENFSGKENRILMHVLCPSTKELEVGVECSSKDERFNELQLLKALQHPHIVQLQAYSESVWPQFYITEDYMVEALQTLLVNKSRKNNFYSMKELLMFSVDAMEGVRYLHSNNIVHRHLTAAHLFISTSGQVKLSGLMHARKLSEDTIRDFNCSLIPTRWSAPESLKECLFSKTSDMWMVGHLIYEVLTHGRLPYADIGLDDTEVIPVVVDGTRVLCEESCIPNPIYKVISQLTKTEPSLRLSEVKAVIDVLESEEKQMNKDMKSMIFPDIRGEGQAATEHGKGPIASVLNNMLDASDGLYSKGNNEVLKIENSKHQVSLRGLIQIQEVCPKDFSTSVFSRLTSCHLPGISPLISHPRITSDEKQEFSFWLPSEHSMCSLVNAVHSLLLGRDIKEYIQCLANIASVIADLHSHGLVLCDFRADAIYVEKDPTATGQMTKVWLGSLANMRILQPCGEKEDQHIEIAPPQDNEVCGRAAPEVVKDGLYSHASDVFCFGQLMWWVINGFCEAEDPSTQVYNKIEDIYDSSLGKIPQACPRHIYTLIKWCCLTEKNRRPPIHVVQKYLTGEEEQFPIDIDYENAEDGYPLHNKDKDSHSSTSSGYISESISSTTLSISCEPPPLPPRRTVTSSISPRSPKEINAPSSPECSPPPLPPRLHKLSTTSLSPPHSPPPLPPRQIKKASSLPPHSSPASGAQAARSLYQTGPTSPPPLPPRKKAVLKSSTLPPSFSQSLDEPSSAPVQQLPSKPQEEKSSPNSLKTFSSVNSPPVAPLSSIVEDQDSSSWPGAIQSCKKDHWESKRLSVKDISVTSPRKLRRKTRSKSDSIKEFTYTVADSSCDTIQVKVVSEKSGATVRMQTSEPGMKCLVIRGTRGQIQEALRIITINTGKKEEIINTTKAVWIEWVKKAFPDFEKRTYFVPPVCISRVPMVNKISAGHKVLMLIQNNTQDNSAKNDFQQTSVQKSDVLDDEAFQRLVFSLKTFSKFHKEVFMCLSQLPFGSYLGNPDFFPATAHLPLPINLPETWP